MSAALPEAPDAGPAPGTGQPLAAGLQWLRLPIPGGLQHINVWLLEDDDGYTLIDTGMNTRAARAAWDGPLAAQLGGRPLRRIICTHHHPDHAGLAGWLAARHGAAVFMSAPELALLRRLYAEAADPAVVAARLADFAGNGLEATAELRPALGVAGYLGVMSGLPAEVGVLQPGQTLAAGGVDWVVHQLAGHTDGQLVLHDPSRGLLIVGDQVLPRISSNIGVYFERADPNPLDSYLDSFATLTAIEADPLLLPSHGTVFRGLASRLAELRSHHEARLATLLGLLAEPSTAAALSVRLYRDGLDPLNRVLALGETLAHLRYLVVRGRVQVLEAATGPRRFVAQGG